MNRRHFLQTLALGSASTLGGPSQLRGVPDTFSLRYILSSAMFGTMPLAEILPEVRKVGAGHIDIWPLKHGNQREQITEMGLDAFEALLKEHDVKLGVLTHYNLGPFGLEEEMPVAKRFGCPVMVCGSRGPKGLEGAELKKAVAEFCKKMQPHVAVAEAHGVTIAVENHANSLVSSPDSMKWFAEHATSQHLGIAFAPHHLPQDGEMQGKLIATLGDKTAFFYAQQHGMGSKEQLPKAQELLQMPGRGDLDFNPLVEALKKIDYRGFTEIFMHPVPRGIPILDSAEAITAEINRSRNYLENLVKQA